MRRLTVFAVCLAGFASIAFISCTSAVPASSAPADISKARWLLLGPLPNPVEQGCPGFDRDFLAELGGEAAARPHANQVTAGPRWIRADSREGRVDFLGAYPGATSSVAYAYLEFDSRIDGESALKLGSDDGIKAWCNGALVWDNHIHRALRPDEDAVRVSLQKGRNRLLLKVDQGTGGWEFAARFRAMADELREWTTIADPGLRVLIPRAAFANAEDGTCTVVTRPAFAVNERVDLSILSASGSVLGSTSCVTGERVKLPLPAGGRGAYSVRARGAAQPLASAEATAFVLVGDAAETAAQAVRLARATAPAAAQPAATLSLLADELEGKLPASLCTPERNVRAIAEIGEIRAALEAGPWKADALLGLRQWGYRSSIDGSVQPYSLYLPAAYDPARKYGLVLALHGYTDNDFNAASNLASDCPDDFIIAAPFGRGDIGYRSIGEQDALDVLDVVRASYSIDPDRIYLLGWSMGGMGTWRIGQFYADRFAAIAPFCGWSGTEYLGNLRNTPVLVVHGNADPTVPVGMDRSAVKALRDLGANVTYEELPGAGHDAWGAWIATHKGNTIFDFFDAHRRDPWPVALDFRASYLRYGHYFWVRVDEMTAPPQAGHLTARIAGERLVRVETDGITAFALDLRHPRLSASGRITVSVDGTDLQVEAGQADAALARGTAGSWHVGVAPGARVVRHDGGGLHDLFTGPLTIVYGTGRKERTELLRRAALAVSDWSPSAQIPVGSTIGRFKVKADTEVSDEELKGGNLLLLGDTVENKLVAAQLAAMPLQRGKDSITIGGSAVAGSGLIAVYPNVRAPRFLAGVAILPENAAGAESAFFRSLLGVRAFNVDANATAAVFSYDVIVFQDMRALYGQAAAWLGYYDRNWQNPRPARLGP